MRRDAPNHFTLNIHIIAPQNMNVNNKICSECIQKPADKTPHRVHCGCGAPVSELAEQNIRYASSVMESLLKSRDMHQRAESPTRVYTTLLTVAV